MANVLLQVRNARHSDAMELLDIDIKCFEDAWSPEEWDRTRLAGHSAIVVLTWFGSPIGFVVLDNDGKSAKLRKLAVKPNHRLHGASRRLFQGAIEYMTLHNLREIVATVPESTIYPGPNNLSCWLSKLGFRARMPFIKNYHTAYGQTEDGVEFVYLP